MTPPANISEPVGGERVIWVSPSYGYHGDLMYFGEIFRAFIRRFPDTLIPVKHGATFHHAADLPLVPMITSWSLRWKRMVRGVDYGAGIDVPKPGFVRRMLGARADCLITIEFTGLALIAMAAAALRPAMGRVLLVESDPRQRGGSSHPLVLAIKRIACARAHVIQTNTAEGRAYLIEVLRADPARVRVAPYLTSCPPRPDRASLLSQPMAGDGTPKLRLLFVNSLQPRKGADHLLAALALLPDAVAARIDLTIVGDGPERSRLAAMAAPLADRLALRFLGAKPYRELGQYYAAADVLVIPSIVDYRSLAGFEGLAYGLALIQSRFDGAARETIVEGETGFAIDPANHADFAARITALVSDPALLARCRAGAARLYAARFSVEQIADNIAQSVRLAIARARG